MTTPSRFDNAKSDWFSGREREEREYQSAVIELINKDKVADSREVQVFLAHSSGGWHAVAGPSNAVRSTQESAQSIEHIESRLEELQKKLQASIDIGLENRKLLEQLLEEESRIGLGAIHSLDQGKLQLSQPLIYSYQVLGDEVVAGIEELRVYGVGATEFEAVKELQEELWSLMQDLEQTPPDELGVHLQNTLATLMGRK